MNTILKISVLLLLIILGPSGFSQDFTGLPKQLADGEKSLVSGFQFKNTSISSPPSLPVRSAAEWEEVEYLVLTWQPGYSNILRQLVEVGIEECKVLIITNNVSGVQSYLTTNGVDLTNVEFLNRPWDSIWIRDYAGNTVYTDDVGERALVDWIYNRPRPNDNQAPAAHAAYVGIPIYRTNSGTNDLVNTGGNFMSDGMGNAFASKLILEENEPGNPYGVSPKTEAQIDGIMEEFMGITNYIKMDQIPYDAIDHIDMHMKLLDEETILVSQYPPGVADGPFIEANIDYVTNNFQTPFGTDYKIEWIPAPPSSGGLYPDNNGYYRTFTNSVFINKTIVVPTYRPEVDAAALAMYETLMPGYNIVGIDVDNSGENLIAGNGAIHCITHTIGVADPLWIVHQPLTSINSNVNIPLNALIKHDTGISDAKVYWREQGTQSFQTTDLTADTDDMWTTSLSVPGNAEKIEYYIWAEANSGKTMTRPIVAPDGFWTFEITSLSVSDWAKNNITGPTPNPAKDMVEFNLKNISGEIGITIHNVLGQQLYSNKLDSGNGKISLSLNPEWKGTLFVTFSGDFGKVHKKLIKL